MSQVNRAQESKGRFGKDRGSTALHDSKTTAEQLSRCEKLKVLTRLKSIELEGVQGMIGSRMKSANQ